MIQESSRLTRLCPHCANTIAEDSADCFYCKADFSSESAPAWLKRDELSAPPRTARSGLKMPAMASNFVWSIAILVVALLAFFAGTFWKRSDSSVSQANLKQIQAKDLMIQSQEGQLAQARQKLDETSNQLGETKKKLEESQKELTLAQQKLGAARQASLTHRAPAPSRIPSRVSTPAQMPQPVSTRPTTATGVYETTRSTSVHEDPSSSSRVISQIERGTRINVVHSANGWLEVRSRRGNPPGYVRSDDARAAQ